MGGKRGRNSKITFTIKYVSKFFTSELLIIRSKYIFSNTEGCDEKNELSSNRDILGSLYNNPKIRVLCGPDFPRIAQVIALPSKVSKSSSET